MQKRSSLINLYQHNKNQNKNTSPRSSSLCSLKTFIIRRKKSKAVISNITSSRKGESLFELKISTQIPKINNTLNIKKICDMDIGGSGATIYKAKMGSFSCCIKEMSLKSSQQDIQSFENEISILKKIPHSQHIVDYIGYHKTTESIQLIMGIYDGSLLNVITYYKTNKMMLSEAQISSICLQIVYGLSTLHNKHIIHRDLKSANILYEGDVRVFDTLNFAIADFGESKKINYNKTSSIKGTPRWIAPEVLECGEDTYYGLAADIWSFGMVLFELITSQFPYSEHMFASPFILKGERPNMLKEHKIRYSSLLPIWEGCTTKNIEDRMSLLTIKRMLLTNLEVSSWLK